MRSEYRRRSSGFTLFELLVVILIIAVLAFIGLGIYQQARNAAWKMKARDSARQIATTWNSRLIEDRKFPDGSAFCTTDHDACGLPNALDSITFETCTNNMTVLNMLEQSADQRLAGMKDKWDRFFRVRLDTNYDGTLSSPIDSKPIRANVLVWSLGPRPTDPSNSWIMVWPQ